MRSLIQVLFEYGFVFEFQSIAAKDARELGGESARHELVCNEIARGAQPGEHCEVIDRWITSCVFPIIVIDLCERVFQLEEQEGQQLAVPVADVFTEFYESLRLCELYQNLDGVVLDQQISIQAQQMHILIK